MLERYSSREPGRASLFALTGVEFDPFVDIFSVGSVVGEGRRKVTIILRDRSPPVPGRSPAAWTSAFF